MGTWARTEKRLGARVGPLNAILTRRPVRPARVSPLRPPLRLTLVHEREGLWVPVLFQFSQIYYGFACLLSICVLSIV